MLTDLMTEAPLCFRDVKIRKLIMDGLMSPHLFRLFDEGKRKPWPGAREEIIRVNELARA